MRPISTPNGSISRTTRYCAAPPTRLHAASSAARRSAARSSASCRPARPDHADLTSRQAASLPGLSGPHSLLHCRPSDRGEENMADIRRIDITQPPGPRMSRCVVRGDTVYLAALTAADTNQDIKGQTAQILERIDHYLREAGTSKSNLLTANLWIKDMALFRDMNSVWNEWVDPQNPPARACVRADLARPEVLVEIMVTAAK